MTAAAGYGYRTNACISFAVFGSLAAHLKRRERPAGRAVPRGPRGRRRPRTARRLLLQQQRDKRRFRVLRVVRCVQG